MNDINPKTLNQFMIQKIGKQKMKIKVNPITYPT